MTSMHAPTLASQVTGFEEDLEEGGEEEEEEEETARLANESARVDDGVKGIDDKTSDDAREWYREPIEFAFYEGRDLSAQYWGPTRDITEEALVSLVKRHINSKSDGPDIGTCSLLSRQHGVYNSGYILQLPDGQKVCVRVPACGWSKRWNQDDTKLLRQTALAMRMLKMKTALPLPKVIAYDCSMKNEIGAPSIILSCIGGTCARQAWNAEEGPIPREMRRQNILRSIAQAMAGLRDLKYPRSGSFWFRADHQDEPEVGKSRVLKIEGYIIEREFVTVKPYGSTRAKVITDVQKLLDTNGFPDDYQDVTTKGCFELYRLIAEAFFDATGVPDIGEKEDFVLVHADFDIQNMLVDDEGNLAEILDWDGLSTQPRQAGWNMAPFWLQQDWSPSSQWPPAIGVNYAMVRPDEFDKYRQDYARYLWEACGGVGDCRFTSKSHLYRAFLNSTSDRYAAVRFVENVLADILPRSPSLTYCAQLGEYGFRSGEKEWVETRLLEFFRPEPPRGVMENSGESLKPDTSAGSWAHRSLAYIMAMLKKP